MRDLSVIAVISVVAIIIGTVLFFFGPASLQSDVSTALTSAATGGNPSVPYTTLAKGTRAVSITDRTNYHITNSDDFASLWALVYGQKNVPPFPTVDFSKYEILALFDGTHSGGGFDITPASISDANGKRMVVITHSSPDPSCAVATNATSPFVILEVPKTPYSLTHKDVSVVTPCP
jgi:hypothetical protein